MMAASDRTCDGASTMTDPEHLPSGVPPLPSADGGFRTVLADPPWRLRAAGDGYDTQTHSLTPAALGRLPVAEAVADDAHLYLWVPNSMLADGLGVVQAWGFRHVANLVWAKRRRDGGPDGRSMGFYFRNVTELLLFGVRGTLRTLPPARRQPNLIDAPRREFGRKPDEQYPIIEACSPGPYLELFARHPREGWTTWAVDYARRAFGQPDEGEQLELPIPSVGPPTDARTLPVRRTEDGKGDQPLPI